MDTDSIICSISALIEDEDKVVTYKCLCSELALSSSQAKRYLQKYVSKNQSDKNLFTVTYCISGRNERGLCMYIVRDKDLEKLRSNLKEVFSESIYSVQKCEIKDATLLYSTDYDYKDISQYGQIKYTGATKNDHEQAVPHQGDKVDELISAKKVTPTSSKTKANFFKKVSPKTEAKKDTANDNAKENFQKEVKKETKHTEKIQKPTIKPKKGGMAAFLTKGKTDPFASSTKTKTTATQNKVASPVKPKPQKQLPSVKRKNIPERMEDEIPLDGDLDDFQPAKKEPKQKQSSPRKSQTKSSTSGKRKNSSNKPQTKRRRIQELSSSSESDSDNENEEDRISEPLSSPPLLPPSPVDEVEKSRKIVTEVKEGKTRQKKKVLKIKTYEDEDGELVTERYFVYESCSSGEEDMKDITNKPQTLTKNIAKKIPEKPSVKPHKKTKQGTLSGFFTKKAK